MYQYKSMTAVNIQVNKLFSLDRYNIGIIPRSLITSSVSIKWLSGILLAMCLNNQFASVAPM